MKRKLVGLATLALMANTAFAQSNVSIYGTIDVGIQHGSSSGVPSVNKVGPIAANFFGFKGTESLGNDLNASFVLEGTLALDTGNGATVATTGSKIFNRQSLVSLGSNSLGTVSIGRVNTFGRAATIRNNASSLSLVDGQVWFAQTAGMTISGNGIDFDNTGARISNAVSYLSPSINGLKFGVIHAFAETVTGAAANVTTNIPSFNFNEVAVIYDNGPLTADYVYNHVSTISSSAFASTLLQLGSIDEHYVGASYDFGVLKLTSSYQTRKTENTAADKIWTLGSSIPVTANSKVSVSYAKLAMGTGGNINLKGTNTLGKNGIGFGATTATVLDDASALALSYQLSLSKRTSAYTTYTKLNNSGLGTINNGSATPVAGGSTSLFSVGIQHSF